VQLRLRIAQQRRIIRQLAVAQQKEFHQRILLQM
jgi:hypothetical protein